MDGGIKRFLGVVRAHRGAIEYDFRARFGLGLRDVGSILTITEAARLTEILASDTSSHTAASLAGWDRPASAEEVATAALFNIWADRTYPMPWDKPKSTVVGRGEGMAPSEFKDRWRELAEQAERARLAMASRERRPPDVNQVP